MKIYLINLNKSRETTPLNQKSIMALMCRPQTLALGVRWHAVVISISNSHSTGLC